MTTATREGARLVPEDLCPAVLALARRLQALKNNRFYAIMLVKSGGEFHYVIEEKGQAERAG